MQAPRFSDLSVSTPAGWLMALTPWAANLVCGIAYGAAAWVLYALFALPHALPVAGSAASGVALAAALMCGRAVLPGLWLARFAWDMAATEGHSSGTETLLAAWGATTLVIQTEIARILVLALRVLPSKLRRLRKSLHIASAGLLASSIGTGVMLAGLSQTEAATQVDSWWLQTAALLLPEWAGIALVLPMVILWMQDDAWREGRKWRVSAIVAGMGALTLAATTQMLRTDEARTLRRFQDSTAELARRIEVDLRQAALAVQVLQAHLRTTPATHAAHFAEVAQSIREGSPHLQALSWNRLITHAERERFEQQLRADYGPGVRLQDRSPQGTLGPSANADQYVAVQHIAPLASNRAALGLNIYAHPARRAAIEQAIASGQAAITPRIQLVQETGKSWGALYLSPVYLGAAPTPSATPIGFAVAALRMEDIVGAAVKTLGFAQFRLASTDVHSRQGVQYRFIDQRAPVDLQALYEGEPVRPVNAPSGVQVAKVLALPTPVPVSYTLHFAGRSYLLEATPGADFWRDQISPAPYLTLSVGLLLTWIALAAGLTLTGSTQLLTIAVHKRTHQLQDAEAALQATNERLQRQSVQLRAVLEAMD
jgi:CHASE1-domain containing sensor protein